MQREQLPPPPPRLPHPPPRAHAHARPRPTRPPRALLFGAVPPLPCTAPGGSPVREGLRPGAGEGRVRRDGGRRAVRPGLHRPKPWWRRRGPGRPGRPRGDGRGNGSFRRRSRRCRRCPGPAAVARRPLLPWPPLSRAPSPGDNARETGGGGRGDPLNQPGLPPPAQPLPQTAKRTRGGGSTQQRGTLDSSALRGRDPSWARTPRASAHLRGPYVPCTSSMPSAQSTSP